MILTFLTRSSRIMFPGCYSTYKDVEPYKAHNSKPKEWTFIVQTDSDSGYALFPYSELVSASQKWDPARTTLTNYNRDGTRWLILARAAEAEKIRFSCSTTKKNNSLARGAQSSTANHDRFTRTTKFRCLRVTRRTDWWHCAMTNKTCGICAAWRLWAPTKVRRNFTLPLISDTCSGAKLKQLFSFTAYWFAASSFFPTAKILKSGLLVESKPSVVCVPPVNTTLGSVYYDDESMF